MPKHHHHFRNSIPASRALQFIDRQKLDQLLRTLIPEEGEREFLGRCLVEEGPIHHRGSNYLLLLMLGSILEKLPGPDRPSLGEEVPMRLPPHLHHRVSESNFPLRLPCDALTGLLGKAELANAIDCLTDGPPQHALANVVMVNLMERILERLEPRS